MLLWYHGKVKHLGVCPEEHSRLYEGKMSRKSKEQEIITNTDEPETTAENADNSDSAEEGGNGIKISTAWDEKGKNEIGNCVFNSSPDTLKKGEPMDLLIVVCALLALVCLSVMAVSGINKGFTPSMWVLMGCYAFIAFVCLCKPLHYALSKSAWNAGLREKFPVNKGFSPDSELFEDKISVTDALGKKEEIKFESMTGIYETDNFIIFHENDSRIFAFSKEQLKDNENAGKIREILGGRLENKMSAEKQAEAVDDASDDSVKEEKAKEVSPETTGESEEKPEEADENAVKVQSVTSFADKKKKELEELESLMAENK